MEANWQAEAPHAFVPHPQAVERWQAAHRIVGIYEEEVTKEISGRAMTCRGTAQNPVVLLEGRDGARALKLASELEAL